MTKPGKCRVLSCIIAYSHQRINAYRFVLAHCPDPAYAFPGVVMREKTPVQSRVRGLLRMGAISTPL